MKRTRRKKHSSDESSFQLEDESNDESTTSGEWKSASSRKTASTTVTTRRRTSRIRVNMMDSSSNYSTPAVKRNEILTRQQQQQKRHHDNVEKKNKRQETRGQQKETAKRRSTIKKSEDFSSDFLSDFSALKDNKKERNEKTYKSSEDGDTSQEEEEYNGNNRGREGRNKAESTRSTTTAKRKSTLNLPRSSKPKSVLKYKKESDEDYIPTDDNSQDDSDADGVFINSRATGDSAFHNDDDEWLENDESTNKTVGNGDDVSFCDEVSSSNDDDAMRKDKVVSFGPKIGRLKLRPSPYTKAKSVARFSSNNKNAGYSTLSEEEKEAGSKDSYSTDELSNSRRSTRLSNPVRQLQMRQTRSNTAKCLHFNDDYYSSPDEILPTPSPQKKLLTTGQRESRRCFSTIDEITKERLPAVHICYVPPDGKTRRCFALETLYKTAIMRWELKGKDEEERIRFLQPPHFSTYIEEQLKDQIASRFGRGALNIEESDVYKNRMIYLTHRRELQEDFGGDTTNFNLNDFVHTFNTYLTSQMGSGDIYVCPICYTEAIRRNVKYREFDVCDDESNDEEENDSEDESEIYAKVVDPMYILSELDHEFIIPSSFSFKKVADVKAHVRNVHNIDTKTLEGNDLFQHFLIRAPDGLLQRYLLSEAHGSVSNGAMQRYWFQGNNENFVLLRTLVEKVIAMRSVDQEVDESFSKSFPNRSKKIWNHIAAPYERESNEVLEQFINNNNSSSSEEDDSNGNERRDRIRMNPYFDKPDFDIDAEIVRDLREKRKKRNARKKSHQQRSNDEESSLMEESSQKSSDNDHDESSSPSSCSKDEERGTVLEIKDKSSDEEDNWITNKRNEYANLKEKSKYRVKKLQPGKKRLISQSPEEEEDERVTFTTHVGIALGTENARILESDETSVIVDSSDDNCVKIEGEGKPNSSGSKNISPKRRIMLIESDEE